MKILLTFALLLLSRFSLAFDMPVEVAYEGNSMITQNIVYYVKDGIQKSSSMRLSNSGARLVLIIKAADIYNNLSSVLSVAITFYDGKSYLYADSTVYLCGKNSVNVCADNILTATYNFISEDL